MQRKISVLLILFLFIVLAAVGCGRRGVPAAGTEREIMLATTTSTDDSGLLDYFLPFFEAKYGYKVKVVSLGTGQALELARNGDADVVLVHAKDAELEMVAQGYFTDRRDVMYNDFVIVGPSSDPTAIKGLTDIKELLGIFAENKAPFTFISRGDDSGTHKKEQSLWSEVGVSPQGSWYISSGSGMGSTLRMADEKEGYTLTDRGSYLSLRDKLDLIVIFEGDSRLFNQYGIMAVNQANYPHINYEGAKLLIDFFVSVEGQALVADFKPHGDTLFFPNAE